METWQGGRIAARRDLSSVIPARCTAGWLLALAVAGAALLAEPSPAAAEPQADSRPVAITRPAPGPPTIGLALSGGGYRASLHGLAALRALHDLGLLERVRIVSGVSGGSLTAGYYAYSRSRPDYSFNNFESKLLNALRIYEMPRSVLATELLTAGNETVDALGDCLGATVTSLNSLFNIQQALRRCAGDISVGMGNASLSAAIAQFAGEVCSSAPGGGRQAVQACVDRGPEELGAGMTATLVAVALGDDVRQDMQRSFCSLALQSCSQRGRGRIASEWPDSGHPFADLLHLALFKPLRGRNVVRMKHLERAPLIVLINAASSTSGDLWTASHKGAGIRRPLATGQVGTWRSYRQTSNGPALADAVAASACHPLFCRPIEIPWTATAENDTLTDGGIHDNLGVLAIKELLAHDHQAAAQIDLLVVADARRPTTGTQHPTSRVDTVLRVHDMLIDQRSQSALRDREWWNRRCRQWVHVSLIDAGPDEPLSRLSTDLRPIPELNARMLDSAVRRFTRALNRNPCIESWLRARAR